MALNITLVNNSNCSLKITVSVKDEGHSQLIDPHQVGAPCYLMTATKTDALNIRVESDVTRWNFDFQTTPGDSGSSINTYWPGDGGRSNVYQAIGSGEDMILSFGPAFSGKSWMGLLDIGPDDTLASITIPGTHDSATWNGNVFDQCQSWTLLQQLEEGIRWFDLRLNVKGSDMEIYHANTPQGVLLAKDILPVIKSFLLEYNTETIILCINQEGGVSPNFDSLLHNLLGEGLTPNTVYDRPQIPKLAGMGGCVAIMRRDERASFGIRASGWPADDTNFFGGASFCIQDAYGYNVFTRDSEKIAAKWRNINALMDTSINQRFGSDCWYINFTSASSAPVTNPITFAYGINPLLFTALCGRATPSLLGTVPMDFPGTALGLTKLIISMNKLKGI